MNQESLDRLIEDKAKEYGLDPVVCRALIKIESGNRQYACRFEPKYRYTKDVKANASRCAITEETERMLQMTSFGYCQIMGGTCRDMGYLGELPKLFDPFWNLTYGFQFFKKQLDRYDNIDDAVAAYNAGSVRVIDKGGQIRYRNQNYVDKFRLAYLKILEKNMEA